MAEPLALVGGHSAVTLDVVDAPGPIAVARAAAAQLASVHAWPLECSIAPTRLGPIELTTELPGVDPVTLVHLDDGGVVEVGTRVTPGVVLVGRIVPTAEQLADAAAEQLGIRTNMRDISLRCPPHVDGVVTAITRDAARVVVTVTAERALTIGDTLRIGEHVGIVADIADTLPGDVRWPGISGRRDVEKVGCAALVAHARSIGPYSLVTQQPLGGKGSFGGQRVGAPELAALRERGAVHTIHELTTVKSDDIDGRVTLYEALVKGEPPHAMATMPMTARALGSHLRALGFDVDLEADAIAIRMFDDATIRARTRGPVTRPDTINYRTLLPEPNGLMCEHIFGSVKDARSRRTTDGRFELPAPVLHPWLHDAAARRLGITTSALRATLYDQRTLDGGKSATWRDTGAHAVATALTAHDTLGVTGFVFRTWPILPPDLRPLVPLDDGRFAISDLNDLYRRLINRANRLARLIELLAPDVILRDEHLQLQRAVDNVVENGLHHNPIVMTGTHRKLSSLADLVGGPKGYLVARGKRVDYSAQAIGVPRPELVDRVLVPRELAIELWTPSIYAWLECNGHVTRIKEARRLVETRDPRVATALAEIVDDYPVLLFPARVGDAAPIAAPIAALGVALWDAPAFGLPPAICARLGGGEVALHVPLDPRAVAEVRGLEHAPPAPPPRPPHGWLARAACGVAREVLVDAALREEIDVVADADTRVVLGRPPR